jgi:quinol monooxygenase YgiN
VEHLPEVQQSHKNSPSMSPSISDRVVRIAELEIDPEMVDTYKALLAEEIHASVGIEPGVLFLYGVSAKDAPAKVRVFECYASREAYEFHITTSHFLKYKTMTQTMVKSLTLIEVDPIAMAAKSDPRT